MKLKISQVLHIGLAIVRQPFGFFAGSLLSVALVFGQTNLPIEIAEGVWNVGVIEQAALNEASGLTASKRHPGVFWTHNDGGNPQFLFAINAQGEHLGAFELKGALLIDWEAIATDEAGDLYIADTGTNGIARSHSAIHKVAEPDAANRWGPAVVVDSWFIRFPGEREDCEGMFVHGGYVYLVGKYPFRGQVSLYRFPLASDDESILLELVTRIPVRSPVADAALSDDGLRLALLEEDGVAVLFIDGDPAGAGTAPDREVDFEGPQMEGITFAPDGLLVISEADPRILLFNAAELSGIPIITKPLADQSAFTGGLVQFAVEAEGPGLTYAWFLNGVQLPGEMAATLTRRDLSLADAGIYEVVVSSPNGTARSSARLTVSEKRIDLRITEVMSSESNVAVETEDWWELTSFDTRPVDLSGWRFNDSTGDLNDAFVIPAGVAIQPGESVIFVENLTPAEFRAWWGENNVPAGIQIITYSGPTLSFNAVADSLRLWDSAGNLYARVDFGVADEGVSFAYDPVAGQFGIKSRAGVHGAFQAAAGTDVGSPGRIDGDAPVVIQLERGQNGLEMNVLGKVDGQGLFELEASSDPASGHWRPTGRFTDGAAPLQLDQPADAARLFYRLRRQ